MPVGRGNRREFIAALSGAVAWPLMARSQKADRVRRVGILLPLTEDDPYDQARRAAFLQGLQETGWSVGHNLRIDIRWGYGDVGRLRRSAMALAALTPDVILAVGTNQAVASLQASRTVTVVFTAVSDQAGHG
jgi:putative tryptophan/tyrosine transport system substrate-binding protein